MKFGEWHRWFAWYPVEDMDDDIIWFRWCERRIVVSSDGDSWYDYREEYKR